MAEISPFFSQLVGLQRNRSSLNDDPLAPAPAASTPPGILDTGNLTQPPVGEVRPQNLAVPSAKAAPLRQDISEAITRRQKKSATTKEDRQKLGAFTDPETFEALAAQVDKLPEVQQAQVEIAGLDQLRTSILSAPVQTDLRPLFALVDSETGSNLLAGAKPNDPTANLKAASAITKQLITAQNKLSDLKIKGIRAQKTGTIESLIRDQEGLQLLTGSKRRATVGSLSAANAPGARADKAIAKVQINFNKDRGVQKIQESLSATKTFQDVVINGGPIGANARFSLGPRLVGEVGNLADKEQQRFEGSAALKRKIPRWVEALISGNLPDEDKAEFLDFLETMDRSLKFRLGQQADRFALQGERANTSLGIKKKRFRDSFAVESVFPPSPQAVKGERQVRKATGGSPQKLTPEMKKRLEELRRRSKGRSK